MDRAPRVFISYSHDSDEHRARVMALSERLRQDGIETILDRYVNGSPPEGWPRWMLDRMDESDRVILICTPTYYRRFRGHEVPGQGKGVDWEGAIITQEIYDARSKTTRFIPVVFDAKVQGCIPELLRGQTWYCLTSESAYQDLYDALLGQAGVEPGVLGTINRKEQVRVEPLHFDGSKKVGSRGSKVSPYTSHPTKNTRTDRSELGHRSDLDLDWNAHLLKEPIRLDVSHPDAATVDEPWDLAVAVRQPDSPVEPIDDLPTVQSATGHIFRPEHKGVVQYRIEVKGPPDCEIQPSHYSIMLCPGESAAPCWFHIICRCVGMRSFFVNAYQEDDVLAANTRIRIPVKVRVASQQPPSPTPATSKAVATWHEKLDFLLEQEAVAADPAQKFQLRKQIEECRAKIRELGGAG